MYASNSIFDITEKCYINSSYLKYFVMPNFITFLPFILFGMQNILMLSIPNKMKIVICTVSVQCTRIFV